MKSTDKSNQEGDSGAPTQVNNQSGSVEDRAERESGPTVSESAEQGLLGEKGKISDSGGGEGDNLVADPTADDPVITEANMKDDDKKSISLSQNRRFQHGVLIKYASLVILTVQNAALGLSMRYAVTRNVEKFSPPAAVFMAEVMKLLICLFLVMQESGNVKRGINSLYSTVILNYRDTLRVCVPSFLYIIQNNLLYVSSQNLDAATYQVTYQLKILTTAFFAVVVLKRSLKRWQWCALGLLAAGIALVQLANTPTPTPSTPSSSNTAGTSGAVGGGGGGGGADEGGESRVLGFCAALGACFISGFAGIYFEKVLKESDISVWMRNVQLSLLSLPFGAVTYVWKTGGVGGLLRGFDGFVWYLVALQAAGGLVVAVVVKYADNILKGFATSVAILISCVVSIYLFDFSITTQFAAGTFLVIASIFLYGYVPKKKPELKNSLSV